MMFSVASDAMTRTTVDLDPSALDELRRRAVREGKSMGRLAYEDRHTSIRQAGSHGKTTPRH
jgi:hypothetical protein